MNTILAMGGYAMYVWPAYGITLLIIVLNVFFTFRERKHIKKIIHRYFNQTL